MKNYVIFYPELYKNLKSLHATILYQCLYFWSDKTTRKDGYFYKTSKEIEKELCFTARNVRTAIDVLVKNNFIEVKVFPAHGKPTRHFKCLVDFMYVGSKPPVETDKAFVENDNVIVETDNSITVDNTVDNTLSTSMPKKRYYNTSKVDKELNEFLVKGDIRNELIKELSTDYEVTDLMSEADSFIKYYMVADNRKHIPYFDVRKQFKARVRRAEKNGFIERKKEHKTEPITGFDNENLTESEADDFRAKFGRV